MRILTRRGWLTWDEVRAGEDETIGYNPATGRSEWTRIVAVNRFGPTPVKRFGNQYWSVECTDNHRWLAEDMGTRYRYGPRPKREILERHEVVRGESLTELCHLRKTQRVVLARAAHSDSSLPVSTREAALLGWIAGDGTVHQDTERWYSRKPDLPATDEAPFGYRRDGQPKKNRSGAPRKTGQRRKQTSLDIRIGQAKPQHFAAIEEACAGDPRCTRYIEPKDAPRRDTHIWRLSTAYSRDLLARAGHPKADAVAQVLAMSDEQRAAWLNAIIAAEGHCSGNRTVIYQNDGPVADAIELAIYLSGQRPGRTKDGRNGAFRWSIRPSSPYVGGMNRRRFIEDAGVQEVWCPTTELGTWTANQDGQVFLTGNSGWRWNAQNPSSPAYGIPQADPGSKMAADGADWRTNSVTQMKWGAEYIKDKYTTPSNAWYLWQARSPHWYDEGGWLPPGLTLTHNNTGRPEPILTGQQWDMISSAVTGGDGVGLGGRAMAKRLDRMIHLLEQAPGRTAAGVGDSINGSARSAVTRAYFRTR